MTLRRLPCTTECQAQTPRSIFCASEIQIQLHHNLLPLSCTPSSRASCSNPTSMASTMTARGITARVYLRSWTRSLLFNDLTPSQKYVHRRVLGDVVAVSLISQVQSTYISQSRRGGVLTALVGTIIFLLVLVRLESGRQRRG
jgi:hypothetical protein